MIREWGSITGFEGHVFHLRTINEDFKLEETAAAHLVVSLTKNIVDNKEEIIEELEMKKRKSGN